MEGIMVTTDLFNEYRMTGTLFILAFISFAIGGTLPVVGEKGNARIFTLPVREHLLAIANNAVVWRWANLFMGIAAILLVAGLWMLTAMLVQAGERIFSRLGLVAMLVATVLWVVFSAFRGVVSLRAAEELTAPGGTGAVPGYYDPLVRWGFRLFYIYALLAFLALAAYGVSLLQVGLLPAWVGWGTILYCIALLILLIIQGDTLPAFHYLPTLVMGILLLIHG
jgi:hypothetical protein